VTKMDFSIKWIEAGKLSRVLLKDHTKTQYIFALSHATNGPSLKRLYERLLTTREGGEIACDLPEFTDLYSKLSDCTENTVGHALVNDQSFSLETLSKLSQRGRKNRVWINSKHPYVWMARRYRDTHDLFHVLSGYKTDTLGEVSMLAFSYAQQRLPSWGILLLIGLVKVKFHPLKIAAIIEGYLRGKKAKWILGENFETMIHEDLEECRERLNLSRAKWYEKSCKN
jgi:ubiquinone biosynthesis protein COQ4